MSELTPQQHAAGKRAVILSSLYSQVTSKHTVRPSITEPLLLRSPQIARRVVTTENLLPTKVILTKQQEEDNDPLAAIPGWMKFVGVIVIIMLVVMVFGSTTPTQPSQKKNITSPTSMVTTSSLIIRPVMRINQADPVQYASTQEYNTWWGSACSTTSMTEVFNAYGRNYRITDVLKVEAGLQNPQEITPDQGLLNNSAIDRTANYFGFQTTWLHDSLDGIIQRAKAGNPIIVNFPPDTWAGGHFLLVTGGNATQVDLADSSKLDMQVMSRENFLKYWEGLAALVTPKVQASTPSGSYSVIGKPTLSIDFMNQILTAYHSPAAGKAQALYNLGIKYGIDPAFALSFFFHESTFGTRGEATSSLSLGNLRCISNAKCQDGYAWFPSWEEGFEAWYIQIRAYIFGDINKVIGRNACPCTTVPKIIPVYAPTSDNNDESLYIKTVEVAIDTWHAGNIWVPKVA